MDKTEIAGMRRALAESVEHWYENWCDPINAECWASSCPACEYSRVGDYVHCHRCAIGLYVRFDGCRETPWEEASDAVEELTLSSRLYEGAVQEARVAIENEYAFLCDVLYDDEWWDALPEEYEVLAQAVRAPEDKK